MGRRRRHKRVVDVEDEEKDLIFGRQPAKGEKKNQAHAEFGERVGSFVASEDEWPAKTILEDDSDVNAFVRGRSYHGLTDRDLSPRVSDAILDAIENKEQYLSSKEGKGRKQYTEIATAWAGGTAEMVAEKAMGIAGKLKSDMTRDDDD